MANSELFVEVSEGFKRQNTPVRNKYSIRDCARLVEISTINSKSTVKNQPKIKLKTILEHQMGYKLTEYPSTQSGPYICYMHRGGN